MLSFSANMIVISDTNSIIKINEYVYKIYVVSVAQLEMLAYFDIRNKVNLGELIVSNNVFLTNHDLGHTPAVLALRVGFYTSVPNYEFEKMKYLEVRVNGRLIKSNKVKVKYVGAMKKAFLPCTICIKNENKKTFNMFLVSFCKLAIQLDKIPSNSYIDISARLFRKMHQEGFELNLSSFLLVNK